MSTWVPGGRGAMLEWWFGHLDNFETYKRWHPDDHLAFGWVQGWEPGRFVGATDNGSVGDPVNDLCHLALDRPGGFELRSNLWIAPHLADMIEPLKRHCQQEMVSLADFLPELYAEATTPPPGAP